MPFSLSRAAVLFFNFRYYSVRLPHTVVFLPTSLLRSQSISSLAQLSSQLISSLVHVFFHISKNMHPIYGLLSGYIQVIFICAEPLAPCTRDFETQPAKKGNPHLFLNIFPNGDSPASLVEIATELCHSAPHSLTSTPSRHRPCSLDRNRRSVELFICCRNYSVKPLLEHKRTSIGKS